MSDFSVLKLLLEMPVFIDKEMPIDTDGKSLYYSEDTIKSDFDIVAREKILGEVYRTLIKKTKSIAVFVKQCIRPSDKKPAAEIIVSLDLKF